MLTSELSRGNSSSLCRRESLKYKKYTFKLFIRETVIHLWETKRVISIGLIVVFLLLLILIIVFALVNLDSVYFHNYAIILDAGISGTRLFLYKWKQTSRASYSGITKIDECMTIDIEIIFKKKSIGKIIDCLKTLQSKIDIWYIVMPPVYLVTTEPYRAYKNDSTDRTMKHLEYLKKNLIKEKWTIRTMTVIPEKALAFSIWKAINFDIIMGDGKINQTISILNLKDDNMQIVAGIKNQAESVTINGRMLPIYARNYQCYGSYFIYEKYRAKAIDTMKTQFNCLSTNSPIFDSLFARTCWRDVSRNLPTGSTSMPDQAKCRGDLQPLANILIKPGFIGKKQKFYAINLLGRVMNLINTLYPLTMSIDGIRTGTTYFCNEDYNEMLKRYPKTPEFASKFCFTANYASYVYEIMGFNNDNFHLLEFPNKLSSEWTKGYISTNAHFIPPYMFLLLNKIIGYILISIFTATLFTMIVIFIFSMWTRYKNNLEIQQTRRQSMMRMSVRRMSTMKNLLEKFQ